jgi:hypothetical protein
VPEIAETAPTTQPADATPPESQEPVPQSVEEVEAIWRNRVSQKDKAHAAEAAELRRQVELLKNPATPVPNETPEQARIRELEARLAETERQRQIDIRRARFPRATEYLGDVAAAADEAKLAGLEALLAGEPEQAPAPAAPRVPNSAPRRGPTPPKTYEEMTKQELLDQLRTISGPYQQHLKEKFG